MTTEKLPPKSAVDYMAANGFVFMFDLEGSDHCDGRGPQPPGMFPRVVAAYGLSQPPEHGRESDDTRMRRWMGPTQEVFGTGWDKGPFIAFSIGGEISGSETNVFSHRRELNRGWPERPRERTIQSGATDLLNFRYGPQQVKCINASLRIQLLKQTAVDLSVSVRLASPLAETEIEEFKALGIVGASAGRRVLYCKVAQEALKEIAKHEKVVQVSLVEQMRPIQGN
jgi:hypothetical protein